MGDQRVLEIDEVLLQKRAVGSGVSGGSPWSAAVEERAFEADRVRHPLVH